jgi:hypothetical protein
MPAINHQRALTSCVSPGIGARDARVVEVVAKDPSVSNRPLPLPRSPARRAKRNGRPVMGGRQVTAGNKELVPSP